MTLGPSVLVTAGTGTVARHVVGELADRGLPVRVGTRDPATARARFGLDGDDGGAETDEFDDFPTLSPDDPVEFSQLDFERPETWGPTLDGIDRLFSTFVPEVGRNAHRSFVAAAARVGVEQIAYRSTLGANRNPLVPHHWNERHLRSLAVDHTLLRTSSVCQNLHDVHGRAIRDRDKLSVPAGSGARSFVDARDVAAVGAAVLAEPGHLNCSYDVTGPEALTYEKVADVFSTVLDSEVEYVHPSILRFLVRRSRKYGLRSALERVGSHTATRLGLAGRVGDGVPDVLDRPARPFREYVEDYRDSFERDTNSV